MASSAILGVHIVGNGQNAERAFRSVARAADRMQRQVQRVFSLDSSSFTAGLFRAGGAIAGIGAKITAIVSLIPFLIGALGSVGFGLMGVGLAAAPALAAVMLGMDGIKAAAKTIAPQLDSLKSAVSSTFEQSMAPAFAKLGGLMTSITPAMQGIAESVSSVFSSVVDTITGPGLNSFNLLLSAGKDFIGAMGPGISQLVQGLLDFGAAVAPVASQLGTAFGGVLGTIGQVFSQLQQSGTLTALFDGFAQVLDGVSATLGPLLTMLAELGAVVGPMLGQMFQALGSALTGITPAFSQIAGTVGTALVQIFDALAPVLPVVANAFASLVSAVAPLIPPLAQLVAIFAGGLAQLVQALAPAFQAVAEALSAAIMPVLPIIADMFTQMAPVIAEVATGVGQSLVTAIQTIAPILPTLATAFTELLMAVLPILPTMVQLISAILPPLASLMVELSPITLAVVSALTELANIVAGVLSGAVSMFTDLMSRLGPIMGPIGDIGARAFNALLAPIRTVVDAVQGLINIISNIRFPSPPSWLSGLFSAASPELRGVPAVGDFFRFLPPAVSTFGGAPPDLTAAQSGFASGGFAPFAAKAATPAYVDQRTYITVDGSVLSTDNALAELIANAIGRTDRTRGASPAVVF